jgi:cell division protein FtsQ
MLKRLNKNKVRNVAIWMGILFGIGGLLFLSVQRKRMASVDTVVIHIQAAESGRLIQEKEVKALMVKSLGFSPDRKKIRSVNSQKLERDLKKDARIQHVDVYFDAKDRLHIALVPKEVIVRITDNRGSSYFLDAKGKKVPVVQGSAVRVPLANGFIDAYREGFDKKEGKSVLKDIFYMIQYIRNDEFLHALVEQIFVDENGEIILIPKVGKEKIVFGGADQMDEKFDNLKIFYRDGMTKLGWNRYPVLNVKFVNQVVLVDGKPEASLNASETAMKVPSDNELTTTQKTDN